MLSARVACGAILLDRLQYKRPELFDRPWRDKISRSQVMSDQNDVLSQVFGGWDAGWDAVRSLFNAPASPTFREEHGFDVTIDEVMQGAFEAYERLTAMWLRVIDINEHAACAT